MKTPSQNRQWTNTQVVYMRHLRRALWSVDALRAKFGGTKHSIRCALDGVFYRDVPDPILSKENKEIKDARKRLPKENARRA